MATTKQIGRPWTQWDFEGGAPPDNEARLSAERDAAHRLADLARTLVAGAVVRGRCVWCSHRDDPADGKHTDSCIVTEAQTILASIPAPVPANREG